MSSFTQTHEFKGHPDPNNLLFQTRTPQDNHRHDETKEDLQNNNGKYDATIDVSLEFQFSFLRYILLSVRPAPG